MKYEQATSMWDDDAYFVLDQQA